VKLPVKKVFRNNEATIKKYIQDQENYDIMQDKLSVKEYEDPFKGTESK